MITERLKIWILLLVVAGCGTGTALAQKMVKVSGTVYNIAENRKVPFSDVTVDVYAAKTVAVGEDMKKILDSNDQEKTLLLDQEGKTTTDENGYYEILVPDNGALIFKVGLSPSVLKEVRHQMKIDVSIDEGVMLESVTVTAMRLVLKPEPTAPKMIGNMLIPYNTFKLPPYFGNRFSRLIIQPYVLDCETNDTVTFARPSVYDGKEYALTQERKMGYDMDRDPLRPYIKAEALTTRAMNLDWTDTIIVPYLDELRVVNYNCLYEIYREPNDEEVMAQYREKGLKGSYTRYEYWKLFQLITDEKELEALYRRAYEESLEQKHPWALAGNNLAASYLERDTVDTSILEPLIDLSIHSTDYSRMNADGSRTEIVNRLEVVTNQLCMYIKKGDFEHASVLVKILPEDSKFDLLKAYTWALGGYFQGGTTPEEKERAQKTFETIKASSPQNEVVMYMALDNRAGNAAAKASLAKLPQDSALTWYFKATLSAREGEIEFMNTVIALSECFKRDKSFVATAQNDGEFNEDIIQAAMDMSNL